MKKLLLPLFTVALCGCTPVSNENNNSNVNSNNAEEQEESRIELTDEEMGKICKETVQISYSLYKIVTIYEDYTKSDELTPYQITSTRREEEFRTFDQNSGAEISLQLLFSSPDAVISVLSKEHKFEKVGDNYVFSFKAETSFYNYPELVEKYPFMVITYNSNLMAIGADYLHCTSYPKPDPEPQPASPSSSIKRDASSSYPVFSHIINTISWIS